MYSRKKGHGYAFQSVTDANGLILDLSGPYVGRYNDLMMFRESRIEERLINAITQTNLADKYIDILADKIYAITERVRPLHKGAMTVEEQVDNAVMSKIRVPEEWIFGKIEENWKGLFHKRKVKVAESPHGKYYLMCALFTNIHTILYGSQSQSFSIITLILSIQKLFRKILFFLNNTYYCKQFWYGNI